MATKAQVEISRLAESMARTDAPHIGSIVMWTLTGCRISREELVKLYDRHGLDHDWLPPEIEGGVAFHKAIREVKQSGWQKGYMIRPIDDNKDAIVLGIVKEDVNRPNEDLAYGLEAKVKYDKKNEAVRVTDSNHPLAAAIKAQFKDMVDTYVSIDFIRLLSKNIGHRMDSVCLRKTGGTYFVPAHKTEVLLKHRAIMTELGAEFSVLPLYGNDLALEDVGKQARRSLEEEIKEIEVEIMRFKEAAPRSDTLRRRIEEFKTLKAKAEMYSSLLSIKVKDINQGIEDCTSQVKKILGVVEKEKEEKKAATRKGKKEKEEKAPVETTKVKNVVKVKKAPRKKPSKKVPAKKKPTRKAKTKK